VRKAIALIQTQAGPLGAKLGFRSFRLAQSNFKIWQGEAANLDDKGSQLDLYADHILDGSQPDDILFELLLKDGFPPTVPLKKLEVAGKDVISVAGGVLVICLDKELTQEVMDALADIEPSRVICLDAGFQGNDQLKANAVQTFKSRARNRETAIEFRTV
jgi:adenine-specific DNA-methyltransferase